MKKLVICFVVTMMMFTGCTVNKLDDSHQTINLDKTAEGNAIVIEVTKGENYVEEMGVGPVKFNVIPQTAIWAETLTGEFIETLYITGAHGVGFHHGKKGELGETFYKKCLPVWAAKVISSGAKLPSNENKYTRAVTSATPMSDFTVRTFMENREFPIKILLEINKSGDDNVTYNKGNNDWAGQPSLIYAKTITGSTEKQTFYLELIGHGGMLKDKPSIYSDLSGFDSALTQINKIKITLN